LRDSKDGEVGRVGYEINFNRYFYEYQPPRPLEEIEADIKTLEKEIMDTYKTLSKIAALSSENTTQTSKQIITSGPSWICTPG